MKTQEELNELKEKYESLSTKLKELTEDELKIVTGGTGGAKTMIISVQLPSNIEASSILDVYVDGIKDSSESALLVPGREFVYITIKDTVGCVHVDVRINNVTYKEYDVDFDRNIINEL